jgi:ADP-glucose pyrophosphorylase
MVILLLLLLLLPLDHIWPFMNSTNTADSQLGGGCSCKLATAHSVLASCVGVKAAALLVQAV